MKKIFFSLSILCLTATVTPNANAKSGGNNSNEISVPASQIPQRVLTQFASTYRGATNVQWNVLPPAYYGTAIYQAKFKLNGSNVKVNFL